MKEVKLINRGKYPLEVEKTVAGKLVPYRIYPNQPGFYAESVAELFLKTYPEDVYIAKDSYGLTKTHEVVDTRVWLANNTGNPKFAKTYYEDFPVRGTAKKVWDKREMENAQAVPRPLKWKWNLGEWAITEQDKSTNIFQNPFVTVQIDPFERRPFDKDQANWLLNRTRGADPSMNKSLIKSRAPTAFEPDMSWTYEDMRLYAALTHVDFKDDDFLGESPEDIKERAENRDEYEILLVDAKDALYRKLFFYLIDPAVRLPDENMFRLYSDKKEDVKTRRRGRPPQKHKQQDEASA